MTTPEQAALLAKMNRQLAEISTLKAEVADLREQLDRALVPKYKVGDRVTCDNYRRSVAVAHAIVTGVSEFRYSLHWDGGETNEWPESRLISLAPLEAGTPCPLDHRQNDMRTSAFRPWKFCPLCGESLTKEDV